MENNTEELEINIFFCPYCGSQEITMMTDFDLVCTECNKEFKVMTNE